MGEILKERTMVAVNGVEFDPALVLQPIDGDASGKNLLYMEQLDAADIYKYIDEAYAAESTINDPSRNGINLLPHTVLKAVMRQPSTRTGGSMTTAMKKLGGHGELISGMHSSSEAKGETLPDSWVAFATQADIIGTRTEEDWGPALAAYAIHKAVEDGHLWKRVPVLSLGDGRKQHTTQTLGDLFTIHKHHKGLDGLTITVVGDHERYRAHHSLMIGAAALGMRIMAVESSAAPIPQEVFEIIKSNLVARIQDLDSAISETDVLYLGRNPDEYTGNNQEELLRAKRLATDYEKWVVDYDRIQKMKSDAIVMHPRPRRNELNPNADSDHRMRDIEQMSNMIAMRMAIIARHSGKSIIEAVKNEQAT